MLNAECKRITTEKPYHRFVSAGDKKQNAFFSVVNLLVIFLSESKYARQETIKFSDMLKTGELHNKKAEMYRDVTCGERFRSDARMCAASNDKNELRVALHGWLDDMTSVRDLSSKAKEHKYTILLLALLNLPLHVRHFMDYILLAGIFQVKHANKHGGMVKILCGDGFSFAKELDIEHRAQIELPDDEKPGEKRQFDLVISLVLMSFDWLANGDFGCFAGSVSAKHPCMKCHWTKDCPCAYTHLTDPSQCVHIAGCKHKRARTHTETLQLAKELDALKRSGAGATRISNFSKESGIFKSDFSSKHLLRDVVDDPTIDIMHVTICGFSRNLWSFVSDELIPKDFSWDDLNARVKQHCGKRGRRIPSMAATLGSARGSCAIKLTAAEMLAFTADSDVIVTPLVKRAQHPAWQCWLKHVEMVRFVLRHEFSPEDDAEIQ
jgi:hypothetical protein